MALMSSRATSGRGEKRIRAGCGIEVAKCADASNSFAIVVAVAEPYSAVFDLIRSDDFLPLVMVRRNRVDPQVFGPKPDVFFGGALGQRVEFRSVSVEHFDDTVRTYSEIVFTVFEVKTAAGTERN